MTRADIMKVVCAVCIAALALLIPAADAGNERCPSSSKGNGYLYTYGEKCYQFVLVEKTWNEAKAWCYSKGAALMNLENSSKRQWAESILNNRLRNVFDKNGFWIGLHDRITENQWYWDEGPGVPDVRSSHFNWYPGEPNDLTGQDCVYMRRGYNWKWVDVGCDGGIGRYYSFACEHKMLPTTTTSTTTTTTTTTTTRPRTPTTTTPTTPAPTTPTTTTTSTTEATTTTSTTKQTTPTTTTLPPTTSTTTTPATTTTPTTTSTTTTTTTARPTTTIMSTRALTTTTASPTTSMVVVTEPETTKMTEAPVPLPVPVPGPGDGSQQTKPGDEDGSPGQVGNVGASRSGDSDESRKNSTMTTTVPIVMSLLAIIVLLVLVIFFLYRRRNRKEPAMAHNLENPCYVHSCDAPPTNDLGGCGEESDYATCHVQDNGNVYVEFGDSQLPTRSAAPASCSSPPPMAFSNKRYMEMPPSLPNIDLGADDDNAANDMRAAENTKQLPKSKYLDDYDMYTEDGYMAPKHVYADVKDVPPRSPCPPIPQHYDVVKSPMMDRDIYEDPQAMRLDSALSPSYSNIPVESAQGALYDIPRLSATEGVASEYSSTADLSLFARSTPAQYDVPSNRSSSNNESTDNSDEGHYDHPRNLNDFESKETCA